MWAFRLLAKARRLRGTPLDVFGYTHERRMERALMTEFEGRIGEIVERLTPANHALAVGLAAIPQKMRGFGFIKERNIETARKEEADLLERFRAPSAPLPIAAE
jgi:indolepyruvate ferredoxin oxidoreductase